MSEATQIGDVIARRGEKKTGYLKVSETAVAPVLLPIAIVNGSRPGPTLCISGGVHGTEYSTIDGVIRVLRHIDPGKLSGKLLVVPVMNMAGFDPWGPQGGISTPFQNPIDCMNMNRVFPGNPEGTMSYQIAAAFVSQILSKANYYMDGHGGDVNEELYSYIIVQKTGDAEKDRIAMDLMAASFDCDSVKIAEGGRGSTTKAAADLEIPSITIETGTGGVLIEASAQFTFNGIINAMRRLKMMDGQPAPARKQRIRSRWNLRCDHGGVAYPIGPLGAKVRKGDKVAEVRSIFGELLETITSPIDGIISYRRVPYPVCRKMSVIGILPDEDLSPPPAPPFP
jgi:hypothetical protein